MKKSQQRNSRHLAKRKRSVPKPLVANDYTFEEKARTAMHQMVKRLPTAAQVVRGYKKLQELEFGARRLAARHSGEQ